MVRANLFFGKKVLCKEDDADVSVMRTFREHVGSGFVSRLHQIVDNHKRRFSTVKVLNDRKAPVILVIELLIFSIAVGNLCGCR